MSFNDKAQGAGGSIIAGGSLSTAGFDPRRSMMARTLEMFEKSRKPRQWLMHVSDSGNAGCCEEEDGSDLIARFACARCKHETDWMHISTVTEAKRGIPCPVCNGMGPNA